MATLARGVAAPRTLAHRLRAPRYAGYLLVLPAIIYVMALIGFPLVLGLWYSVTNTTVAEPGHFIGLQNFVDVAKDPTFRLAVRNTLIIGIIAVVVIGAGAGYYFWRRRSTGTGTPTDTGTGTGPGPGPGPGTPGE